MVVLVIQVSGPVEKLDSSFIVEPTLHFSHGSLGILLVLVLQEQVASIGTDILLSIANKPTVDYLPIL